MTTNRIATLPGNGALAIFSACLLLIVGACGRGGGDNAAVAEPGATAAAGAGKPYCLELVSARERVLLGEPLTLMVSLRNCSDAGVEVRDLLRPEYGMLSVRIGHPQMEEDRAYNPPVRRDGRGAGYVELAPGEATTAFVPVYFGRDGWQLEAPGSYTFQADYFVDELSLISNVIAVDVEIPDREPDLAAARAMMSPGAATYYFLGGGDEQGAAELGALVADAPDTPWAAYAELGLAMASTGDGALRSDTCERLEASLGGIAADWIVALRGLETLTECLHESGREADVQRVRSEFLSRHPHAGEALRLE